MYISGIVYNAVYIYLVKHVLIVNVIVTLIVVIAELSNGQAKVMALISSITYYKQFLINWKWML